MKVKKAVIPAAGFGTRMLPITSVVPKELLPVCGIPVIQYVVQEAVDAGITEIILILSQGKESIAEYFTPNKRLANQLVKNGNTKELHILEKIWDMAKITVVYQDEQKGLGDAVLCASEAVGNESFALLLGDSIIRTDKCDSFTAQLISIFNQYNNSVVGVQEVEECLVSRYGIFEGAEFEDGIYAAKRLLEKPDNNATDSNLAFCARYVFTSEIFALLKKTNPGVNNEIQLTDAMQQLAVNNGLIGVKLQGERFDIGDSKGLLLANLSMTECGCG